MLWLFFLICYFHNCLIAPIPSFCCVLGELLISHRVDGEIGFPAMLILCSTVTLYSHTSSLSAGWRITFLSMQRLTLLLKIKNYQGAYRMKFLFPEHMIKMYYWTMK